MAFVAIAVLGTAFAAASASAQDGDWDEATGQGETWQMPSTDRSSSREFISPDEKCWAPPLSIGLEAGVFFRPDGQVTASPYEAMYSARYVFGSEFDPITMTGKAWFRMRNGDSTFIEGMACVIVVKTNWQTGEFTESARWVNVRATRNGARYSFNPVGFDKQGNEVYRYLAAVALVVTSPPVPVDIDDPTGGV
jgi:hypothetical protein